MTTTSSVRRRIAALLLLPFLLVMAGCGKFHADFEIKDAETIEFALDVAVDEEMLAGLYSSAEDFCRDIEKEIDFANENAPKVAPYEEDGRLGCTVNGVMVDGKFGDGLSLVEEDGQLILTLDLGAETAEADVTDPSMQGLDYRMSFSFPGKVESTTAGEIDGNTVTITGLSELDTDTLEIRADAGGFPWLIVILVVLFLGFLLLLALAAVAFFVLRSRKGKNSGGGGAQPPYASAPSPAPQGGAQGMPGQPSPQPQSSPQPWGQPSPPPAPPQAPQQGGQQPRSQPPQQGGQQPWSQPPNQGGQQPPQPPQQGW
ncbi:hypothetical protein [Brachybacterium sp. Marseille-Q7125]|uniref:LppM family (lipo)protein n=1 Tax=Brachybacterium sp. Marseille-Q7125 TaxID=2932815 RepID=UPI001FF4B9ED|nr:hypothetical protein [Brachybacterium sp. Marseille-Q7125]